MSEILLILAMPSAALLVELAKSKRVPVSVSLAFLSLLAGSAYVYWEMLISPDIKAWVITAYPAFALGAVIFYEWAKMIMRLRGERIEEKEAYANLRK